MNDNMANYGKRANMKKRKVKYNVKRLATSVCVLVIFFLFLSSLIADLLGAKDPKDDNKDNKIEANAEANGQTSGDDVIEENIVWPKPWLELGENETISNLSGLTVNKDEAGKRPVAIVIDNSKEALSQSGLKNAEIMYEFPAEEETVRLIGIFQDIDLSKIGPVRSARSYMVDIALDNDAIFVHNGTVDDATKDTIKEINSPSLDMSLMTEDMQKLDSSKEMPHNAYTFGDGIIKCWDAKQYAKVRAAERQVKLLKFSDNDEKKLDLKAGSIFIEYIYPGKTTYQKSEFLYDKRTGTYKRVQDVKGTAGYQVDNLGTLSKADDEKLEYKNVIVQYVERSGSNLELIGSGEGIYATNGTYTPIKWEKKDHYDSTVYTDLMGNPIEFNKGKTWISMVPTTLKAQISESTTGRLLDTSYSGNLVSENKDTEDKDKDEEDNEMGDIPGKIPTLPNNFGNIVLD